MLKSEITYVINRINTGVQWFTMVSRYAGMDDRSREMLEAAGSYRYEILCSSPDVDPLVTMMHLDGVYVMGAIATELRQRGRPLEELNLDLFQY